MFTLLEVQCFFWRRPRPLEEEDLHRSTRRSQTGGAVTKREAHDLERACFVAPRWRHKAKVNGSTELAEVLGPTRSFVRDALRRVLARNEPVVIRRDQL
jgi:hypothetical protein